MNNDFTKMQKFVLKLLADGFDNASIANALKIKIPTVKMHIGNLFKKTGMKSRLGLVVWYYKKVNQEQELRNLMQDPRYWKNQDSEMVKMVREGFKRLYG